MDISKTHANIFIGRNTTETNHVVEQRTCAIYLPIGHKLAYGWLIVGKSCLNMVHRPKFINCSK